MESYTSDKIIGCRALISAATTLSPSLKCTMGDSDQNDRMSWLARACVGAVRAAAILPVPRFLDPLAASAALGAIAVYRRLGSRHVGRTCLFNPSCSCRAEREFRAHGFRDGLSFTVSQLDRCGGAYALSTTVSGEIWLLTSDGLRFGPDEIAPEVPGVGGNEI